MASLFGTWGADNIIGTQEFDFVSSAGGDDVIRTFALADLANGQTDARVAAADAADYVYAGAGNDAIMTGGGNDTIYGDYGNDVMNGGAGNDEMWGGQGADIFTFRWEMTSPGLEDPSGGVGAGNRDFIGDFHQGEDKIDLSGWQNAVDGVTGFEFTYWGVISHGMRAEATYHFEGANTVVTVGFENKMAEIEVAGHVALNEGDFIFG